MEVAACISPPPASKSQWKHHLNLKFHLVKFFWTNAALEAKLHLVIHCLHLVKTTENTPPQLAISPRQLAVVFSTTRCFPVLSDVKIKMLTELHITTYKESWMQHNNWEISDIPVGKISLNRSPTCNSSWSCDSVIHFKKVVLIVTRTRNNMI